MVRLIGEAGGRRGEEAGEAIDWSNHYQMVRWSRHRLMVRLEPPSDDVIGAAAVAWGDEAAIIGWCD